MDKTKIFFNWWVDKQTNTQENGIQFNNKMNYSIKQPEDTEKFKFILLSVRTKFKSKYILYSPTIWHYLEAKLYKQYND